MQMDRIELRAKEHQRHEIEVSRRQIFKLQRPSGPEIIKALRGARIRFDDRAHRLGRKRAREYRERKSRTLSASRMLPASL